jgi:signal transduction histidine kinase
MRRGAVPSRLVLDEPTQARFDGGDLRRLVPVFAAAVAVAAFVVADPSTEAASSASDLLLAAVPVVAFGLWAYVRDVPLPAVSLAVVVPVIVAQRFGELEPLLFDVSLLAFVVGRWSRSLAEAAVLGLVAVAAPVVAAVIQDPTEIAVGIWILGVAFPWVLGRASARQTQLAAQLDASRRELAERAVLAERRGIARDIHDLVGHGLAAVMLQVTSARHVLRRDPAAAEEALRSAEDLGRRSMNELRQTLALLRSDDEAEVAPLPSATEIAALVDHARAGGLAVELRVRGDLSRIPSSVGVAAYRIAQEALANAALHAPRAQTVVGLELTDGQVRLEIESNGRDAAASAGEGQRPRYGLIGMRERATALGGQFAAGPTPDGWCVRARLPLEASDELPGGHA